MLKKISRRRARLFGGESVASPRFKTLGKVHISSLRDSRRLVKLDSYANRVHHWLEEEGREGERRMDGEERGKSLSRSQRSNLFVSFILYKGIRVGWKF